LDLEEEGAGLQEWECPLAGALISSSLARLHSRFSCQVAGRVESCGSQIESSSEIALVVLQKRYFYTSMRGHAREDVHARSEVSLGMFLPTGIL